MTNIEIEFEKYLPTVSSLYLYYTILKEHKFIENIGIIENSNTLAVIPIEPITQDDNQWENILI